jgi:hypothetical protein
MPLNPPTWKGPDVYYSTNVFVNKVPIALWQPPAGAFNDGSPGTSITPGGIAGYNDSPYGKEKLYRALKREQGDAATGDDPPEGGSNNSSVSPTGPINTAPPTPEQKTPDPTPSAPVSDGNFQLKKSQLPNQFPKNMSDPFYDQSISQYFKMAHIQFPPVDHPGVSLSARQIAGNFIDLCINLLDPIYSEFKFGAVYGKNRFIPGGVFRPPGYGRNPTDHARGMAVDLQMGDKNKNIALWKWIVKNKNLKYWQIIWENSPRTGWVHIAYNQGNTKPVKPTCWTPDGTKGPPFNPINRDTLEGAPPYLK